MSAALPEVVDAWRAVAARRRFQGTLPLATLPRLAASRAATDGAVAFELEFGRDALNVAYLEVQVTGDLPLTCQRTMAVFPYHVRLEQRLGLIARESEEAALPPGYEALLTADGELKLADVVEDELILALPVVPLSPAAMSDEPVEVADGDVIVWHADPDDPVADEEPERANPFAALVDLKSKKRTN